MKRMGRVWRGTLVKVLDTMVKRHASVLFSPDGVDMYSLYCNQKTTDGSMVKEIVNFVIRKLRRVSVEEIFSEHANSHMRMYSR